MEDTAFMQKIAKGNLEHQLFYEDRINKKGYHQVDEMMKNGRPTERLEDESHAPSFSTTDLDSFRTIGDPTADAVIANIMASGSKAELYQFFGARSFDDVPISRIKSPGLADFISKVNVLPAWINQDKFSAASELFRKNGNEFLFMLGIVSLPYCFAAAKGALALYHTEKIRKNTDARLLDTTSFIVDIMREDAFKPEGLGYLVVKQVRLRHALARYYLQQKEEINVLGEVPINQEDMAGTNLAFSYVVLREMHKVGLNIDLETKNAYLHFWAVIGYLLGIDNSLLPANVREAFWLEKRIAHRHFKMSEEGKALTSQLVGHYEANIPKKITASLIKPLMRYFLGGEISGIIGIGSKLPWNPADKVMNLLPLFKRYLFPPVQSFDTIISNLEIQRKQLQASK